MLCLPTSNEEAVLEDQLICLTRQCTHHACEVPIVDGESHDGTGEIAKQYGKVIAAPRGRATQKNAGVAVASGDVLMFLHAVSFLLDDAFRAIESALSHPSHVCAEAGISTYCCTYRCRRSLHHLFIDLLHLSGLGNIILGIGCAVIVLVIAAVTVLFTFRYLR